MASIAIVVSVLTFSGFKAKTKAASSKGSLTTMVRIARVIRASASSDALKTIRKVLIAASGSLLLVASANVAIVKMGGDDDILGFYSNSLRVSAGKAITFINNKGFSHNVFDKDVVPHCVKVEELNHEDYLNAPVE